MYKMVNGYPYTLTNMSDRLALDGGLSGGGNKCMIIKKKCVFHILHINIFVMIIVHTYKPE